jgi:hypothetical protein
MEQERAGHLGVEQTNVEHPDSGKPEEEAWRYPLRYAAGEACSSGSVPAPDAPAADLRRENGQPTVGTVGGRKEDVTGTAGAVAEREVVGFLREQLQGVPLTKLEGAIRIAPQGRRSD